MDQASFLALRATGLRQLVKWVWVYERAVDFDALTRFHRNLGYGLLGRRIERSPLPFGRHRWVASRGPSDEDSTPAARAGAMMAGLAEDGDHLTEHRFELWRPTD